jgi:transcriptional regulator with XRE-family HTH domain
LVYPVEVVMAIGDNIRAARKRAGLSQEALARRADMSLNAISMLERGERADPHYSTLAAIADGLSISVEKLVHFDKLAGDPELEKWFLDQVDAGLIDISEQEKDYLLESTSANGWKKLYATLEPKLIKMRVGDKPLRLSIAGVEWLPYTPAENDTPDLLVLAL